MHSDFDLAIERALQAAAHHVVRVPNAGWRIATRNGEAIDVRTRFAGGEWLELATRVPWPDPLYAASAWPLLRLNASLKGSARLACRDNGILELRADLFVGTAGEGRPDALALESRVAVLCDDLRTGYDRVATCPSPPANDDTSALAAASEDGERLARLAAEAGWHCTPDSSGATRVWLDAGATGVDARLVLSRESRLLAVAPLATAPPASEASRAAVALLLLRLGSTVRAVKGTVTRAGDGELPAIGSAWEPLHSPAGFDNALSAVAVGCRQVMREVQALEDESVARDYLRLRQVRCAGGHERINELEDTPCLQLP